jgi:predicted enzyme related to lactoylglutathione lyase
VIEAAWIDHIHVHVADVERAARFYGDVFGATESFRVGPQLIFLALPNGGVVALDGRPPSGRNPPHVGMELGAAERLDEAVRVVERAGGSLVERGEHAPGVEYRYLADPDGNVFELHASR